MRFSLKIIVIILIFSISSCAFKNQPTVFVTIDSEPSGAKIFVDDIYYGDTAKAISLIPNKNHHLRLIKDGYQTINYDLETKFSMRKNRQEEYGRCKVDLIGSIFIFPIMGLKSLYCRDFTKELYNFELTQIAEAPSQKSQNIAPPFSYQNYYAPNNLPAQTNKNNPAIEVQENKRAVPAQPLFNNRSEFVNDGNEAAVGNSEENKNFNHKKVDYYNWQ